jgi:hypothetical protein
LFFVAEKRQPRYRFLAALRIGLGRRGGIPALELVAGHQEFDH